MPKRIVGFSGSLSSPSRTRTLVDLAVGRTARRFGCLAATYEIGDLQPSLGQAQAVDQLDPLARAILNTILTADALVVGTPVYKGSFTGLFKHLIDLIDPAALAGKPVLLTATGGGDRHALVIEHQMRPLFGFFEAASLPTGVYASGGEFRDGLPASDALLARLDRAVGQFAPWLLHAEGATSSAA
ncbi:FMN reductase [Paracoccus sp. MC1854]|uniref:FMN reductase n=1 Tax=Paracoccus sp. MC1854 TaxID=2760306 RepID=UPI00160495FE|nr:FMN reductase [Paracoccus sp. MC1854]MBB1493138.1 FMN reductase [Paracoccus sp. MC1854]